MFWVDILGQCCLSYIFDGYFLLDMLAVIIFYIHFCGAYAFGRYVFSGTFWCIIFDYFWGELG